MKLITTIDGPKYYLIIFNFGEEYESVEKIAFVLSNKLAAIIAEKIDGRDCRVWKLDIEGAEILLINDDPYGNLLRAESEHSKIVLQKLLPEIQDVFANELKNGSALT